MNKSFKTVLIRGKIRERHGYYMDTFMDRFSHRKNSQEMIQANSAADMARLEQLQNQVTEYNTLLQDMRKVNLKAAENMDKMQKALQESIEKIEELQKNKSDTQANEETLLAEMKTQMEEILPQIKAQMEELLPQIKSQVEEFLPQIKTQMEESFQKSDDFLHRENVKVYRNVQAAMTEELDKRTNVLMQKQEESVRKQKALLPISIIIMLMVIVDIAINLFNIVIKF